MRNDYDSQNEGIRSRARAKRRKTNLILNSLIVIVILLIVFVSANIFFSKDEGATDSKATSGNEKVASSSGKNESKSDSSKETDKKDQSAAEDKDAAEDDADKDESAEEDAEDSDESDEPIVTEGGSDPNVKQTIENPAWEPVGTTQTGEHVTVFEKDSADWQEMLLAYSYATGIDKNNMTVWWNENNGAPNTARGTISAKGSDQTFRVAIEWVDGQGWKPVKVEELHQNDRR